MHPSTDMVELIHQYALLHEKKKGYGRTGENQIPLFLPIVKELNPTTILDHGSGKSFLADRLNFNGKIRTYRYDPAVPELSKLPTEKIDLVLSTDVLEHIPEPYISDFIADIREISENALFAISLRPSGNDLPDGRPCHLTVKDVNWWMCQLAVHFHTVKVVLHDINAKKVIIRTF